MKVGDRLLNKLRTKLAKMIVPGHTKQRDSRMQIIPDWKEGMPIFRDWNIERAIQKGMKSNVWLYACVRKRATALSQVQWHVERRVDDEWEREDGHPLEKLMQKPVVAPQANFDGDKLQKMMWYHLDLGGNAIWHINIVDGTPMEFWPLMPQNIKPVPNKQDYISHYEYRIGGKTKEIPPEEILHFMYVDPASSYWGLPPLKAASKIVDTDIKATEWNMESMDKKTVTDGVFSFKGNMTKQQWQEQREIIEEEKKGQRDIWVLGNDASFEPMDRTPVEMDYIDSKKFYMYEICAVYDVDPLLIGAPDHSGRANKMEAKREWWQNSLIPQLDNMKQTLNQALIPFWEPETLESREPADLRLNYDLSNIYALQKNLEEQAKTAQAYFRMGVPFNAINQRLELGFDEIEDGDEPRGTGTQQASNSNSRENKKQLSSEFTQEDINQFIKSREQDRGNFEQEVAEIIEEQFEEEAEEVIAEYEAHGKLGAERAIEGMELDWENAFDGIYSSVIEYFGGIEGQRIEDELQKSNRPSEKKEFNFDPFDGEVRRFINRFAAEKVTQITATSKERISNAIGRGLEEGETSAEISRRIRDTYSRWTDGDDDIDVRRAMTIARTETTAASEFGNHQGAVQAEETFGVTMEKEWVVADFTDRLREEHEFMAGERQPLNQRYSNGLMYPGDPGGEPESVIQCRCTEIHHIVEDEGL